MNSIKILLHSALIVLVSLSSSCWAQSGKEGQGRRIEYYLQFAFGATEKIRKFEKHPRVTLICSMDDCAKGLTDLVWSAMPSGDELLSAKVHTDEMDIALVPSLEEGNRLAVFEAKKMKKHDFREWGDSRCRTVHWSNDDTVVKFIVMADPLEGNDANSICFAMELMKGSGLAFWSTYDQISQETPENKAIFLRNAGALLKFHWASFTLPGMSKQSTRDIWRKKLGLEN